MAELDGAFKFSETGNSEILNEWLLKAIANKYEPAYPALERFLTSMGRRKFLKPLYTELARTPEGLEMARRIYQKARPSYHSVSYNTVERDIEVGQVMRNNRIYIRACAVLPFRGKIIDSVGR